MENNVKAGHPILGIILGLLGIAAALFLTFATGVIGGGLALIFGILAIVIGAAGKKKGGKGVGAILVGCVAVGMALILTVSTVGTFNALRNEAVKRDPDSLVAKYMDKPYFGTLGIVMNLPKDDENAMQELVAELNELVEKTGASTEAASN